MTDNLANLKYVIDMKKILYVLGAVAIAFVAVMCEKYDDGIPAKSVRNEFKSMYAGAKDVEWEREGAYWKVSFEAGTYPNRVDHEAWYDEAGNWIMTETDLLLSSVPQEIKDFLAADAVYGTATISDNDVEFWQKPDGNFYRFDLRHDGREVEVDVTEDGKVSPAR